jgi:hypothetical protein
MGVRPVPRLSAVLPKVVGLAASASAASWPAAFAPAARSFSGVASQFPHGVHDVVSRGTKRAAVLSPNLELTGRALTVAAPVLEGQTEALEQILRELGDERYGSSQLQFEALTGVHFMRWALVRRRYGVSRDTLLFESNFDGTEADHLAELASAGLSGLDRVYQHCEGYAELRGDGVPSALAVSAFMASRAIPTTAFYNAHRGKSVARIRLEATVYAEIQRWLSAHPERPGSAQELYRAVREHVQSSGLLTALEAPQPRAPSRDGVLRAALRVLPQLAAPLAALPVLLPWLLWLERTDTPWSGQENDDLSEVSTLAAQEDRAVQNALTHVVPLKAGLLRRYIVKRALAITDTLAQHYFTVGNLAGIPSIHFARWALLENDRVLAFFSNYDGSWENYLGDFIDITSFGLSSIWSNTQRFPRTFLLFFAGARDEERFKAWTRAHQVYTQIWYTAYPQLSVKNIRDNARIAAGLQPELKDERAIGAWLRLL